MLKPGDKVNLERSTRLDGRLDGHMVQGHVDQTAVCTGVKEAGGSWYYTFEYEPAQDDYITVEKGSVSVNGVSLTVVNSKPRSFEVAIIPFTWEVTNFHQIKKGTVVNIEFDILGKYIAKIVKQQLGEVRYSGVSLWILCLPLCNLTPASPVTGCILPSYLLIFFFTTGNLSFLHAIIPPSREYSSVKPFSKKIWQPFCF